MRLDALKGERDVLLLSLEDLEREHDAGDLSDEDYEALRDRYTVRAAEVLRALEGGDATPPVATTTEPTGAQAHSPPGRARLRKPWVAATVLALVAVVVLSIVLVTRGTSPRLPGQTVSGSVDLSGQQEVRRTLAQAQALEAQGNASGALALYHQVLVKQPGEQDALAESGWLEYQAGVQAKNSTLLSEGQADEQKAEAADPTAFTPHLYLGSMLLVEGDSNGAVTQYRLFLADGPPTSVVTSAKNFIVKAFEGAGLTPPPLP